MKNLRITNHALKRRKHYKLVSKEILIKLVEQIEDRILFLDNGKCVEINL